MNKLASKQIEFKRRNHCERIEIAIYDSRFPTDPDSSICFEAGLDELLMSDAEKIAKSYGDSNCIVKIRVNRFRKIVEKKLLKIVP